LRRARVWDVFSAAGNQTVLLITHRTERLELVDQVIALPGDGSERYEELDLIGAR
jgi:ABC-type transport system involved in cytochrome bd biosynthesis fused ATPase/permease subunit